MNTKLYPFSAEKHAHDIELVANRAFNLMCEAEEKLDHKAAEHYEEIHMKADDLLTAITDGMRGHKGISMLSGKDIGLAKEYVMLAEEIRSGKAMQYDDSLDAADPDYMEAGPDEEME